MIIAVSRQISINLTMNNDLFEYNDYGITYIYVRNSETLDDNTFGCTTFKRSCEIIPYFIKTVLSIFLKYLICACIQA